MSFWGLLALVALGLFLISAVIMFGIAAACAPRGITTGPAVKVARGLFIVAVMALVLALVAVVFGVVTSWA